MSGVTEKRDDVVAVAWQACSLLLAYPDDGLTARLPMLRDAIATLPVDTRVPLETFLDHLSATSTDGLTEHYVAIFDMRRKCCPYLTYWTHGDTRNRGMALLRFKTAFREAGLTPPEDELPDHLAVVLEFAAVGDREVGGDLLAEHGAGIRLLAQALGDAHSPYAHVLEAVVATLPPMTPELAARAQAMASAGPPTEFVGLPTRGPELLAPFAASAADPSEVRR